MLNLCKELPEVIEERSKRVRVLMDYIPIYVYNFNI